MLDGLKRLLKNGGFSHSESIEKAHNDFRTQSDNVKFFMDDGNYIKSATKKLKLLEVYVTYKNFCLMYDLVPVVKQVFKQRLAQLGVEIKRINIGLVVYLSKK